jgi:hypothetical protein
VTIVGSSILVGLKIKQEQEVAPSGNNLSLLASQIDLTNAINQYGDIWRRGNAGGRHS